MTENKSISAETLSQYNLCLNEELEVVHVNKGKLMSPLWTDAQDRYQVRIKTGQRCGNTTRIINHVIELLYTGYTVLLHDVKPEGSGTIKLESSKRMKDRVVKRMELENPTTPIETGREKEFHTIRISDEFWRGHFEVQRKHGGTFNTPV